MQPHCPCRATQAAELGIIRIDMLNANGAGSPLTSLPYMVRA